MENAISIYEFLDYRCFLKTKFESIKKRNPRFSYRSFNHRAGVKSSAFLKLVIDGKRNLGSEGLQKIIKGFQLAESEAQFFEKLVHFNQASSHEERDRQFRSMVEMKSFIKAKPLTAGQYQLFSHWYYVAILEAVRLQASEKKDIFWLDSLLEPKVSIKEIHKAVRELKKMELLHEDGLGNLMRHDPMLQTPDEVQSLGVVNYHQEMSQLAVQAVADNHPQNREFSALTIAVSPQSYLQAKLELQKFRKKLHALLEQNPQETKTRVVQLNLQLFTLGKVQEKLRENENV